MSFKRKELQSSSEDRNAKKQKTTNSPNLRSSQVDRFVQTLNSIFDTDGDQLFAGTQIDLDNTELPYEESSFLTMNLPSNTTTQVLASGITDPGNALPGTPNGRAAAVNSVNTFVNNEPIVMPSFLPVNQPYPAVDPGSSSWVAPIEPVEEKKTVSGEISHILSAQATIDSVLSQMTTKQSELIDTPVPNPTEISELLAKEKDLLASVSTCRRRLNDIFEDHILSPYDCQRIYEAKDSFALLNTRCELLFKELDHFHSCHEHRPFAALVITKQPFPCTVKQLKPLEDGIELTLLTSAKSVVNGDVNISGQISTKDYNPKNPAPLRNNAKKLNATTNICSFNNIIFPSGSRVRSVEMTFKGSVHLNGCPFHLKSNLSKPFIVMTNHGQRSVTEGRLIEASIFVDTKEVSWPLFLNTLQLHYLRATKQDPMNPNRPLTQRDFDYFKNVKFGGASTVTLKAFNTFWKKWFGKILYRIRNAQKHTLQLWKLGYIYGFAERNEAEQLIRNAAPQSFLLRFSSSQAGEMVVVYGAPDGTVNHYLVKPKDVDSKSSLPDFLRNCGNLRRILRVDVNKPEHFWEPKDAALGNYYSKRKTNKNLEGYSECLP